MTQEATTPEEVLNEMSRRINSNFRAYQEGLILDDPKDYCPWEYEVHMRSKDPVLQGQVRDLLNFGFSAAEVAEKYHLYVPDVDQIARDMLVEAPEFLSLFGDAA